MCISASDFILTTLSLQIFKFTKQEIKHLANRLKFMGKASMKNLLTFLVFSVSFVVAATAQLSFKNGSAHSAFVDFQKTFPRPDESFRRKEDTLQKQFEAKNLQWPAKYIYIRSFKYDSQLEVWVKNNA